MTLRDLPDLDLAALVSSLNEGLLGAYAIEASASASVLFSGARQAALEVIARRQGDSAPDRLFEAGCTVPFREYSELHGLLKHLAGALRGRGFPDAAALLEARSRTEIHPSLAGAKHEIAGLETRTIN